MMRIPALILTIAALAAPVPGLAEDAARVPQSRAEIALSFAPLVRQAAPAVVNIYASRIVRRRSPFAGDPFFGGLFGNATGRPEVENSLGSGVILSADGYVVSNYHVVGQATDIRIVAQDRREFSARIVLADEEADLAILKVQDGRDLPHLPLRDSDTVEVGELVLAIGNPFGVGQTVSSGIVSGLARSGTAAGSARGYFIQTDAPINPGNSGGALVDVRGRLIGVNTSILTRSGGSNGIGFAIPASLVAQFLEQARAGNTRFERPWTGMTGQPLDQSMAESIGLDRPKGVMIAELHPQSPLAVAGLQPGDVVTSVNGGSVNTPAELLYRMTLGGIGGRAGFAALRPGEGVISGEAALIQPPGPGSARLVTTGQGAAIPGMALAPVSPRLIDELDLPLSSEGVAVEDPGPYGSRAGLRRGDILRAINGFAIRNPDDAAAALDGLRAGLLQLDILRGRQRLVLRLRV